MPVFYELGSEVGRLTVLTIISNEVVGGAYQKYCEQTPYELQEGMDRKLDWRFYPCVMHGPEKHYRYILTGNEPYVTKDSAELAAGLLIKYIRMLEPWPEPLHEDLQLNLFAEDLPAVTKVA